VSPQSRSPARARGREARNLQNNRGRRTFVAIAHWFVRQSGVGLVSLPVTSPDGRKDGFYRDLLDRAVGGLVGAVGEEDLDAILLIGAPARGEATVVETPDGLYSLSDIDLVAVSSASADLPAVRRHAASWRSRAAEEIRARASGLDVSIRSRAELHSLPALISTYEMLRSPAVVWGDPSVLESLPTIGVESIPRAESLTLIHNRIVEELLHWREASAAELGPFAALGILYTTAKLALDGITAMLYIERDVPSGYAERVRVFEDRVLSRDPELRGRLADYVDDLPAWADFKTEGDLNRLGAGLGSHAAGPDLAGLARAEWRRYGRYAEVCWREVLGRVTGSEAGALGLADTAALYVELEDVPRSVARAWKASRPGAAPEGLFSRWRLLKGALFASPTERAYLVAVVCYLALSGVADERLADDLVRRYSPFRTATARSPVGSEEERRDLLDRIALFHETLLLGRGTWRH
jgi:hypothetical protein